jgi:hypothetical protein
MEYSAFKVIERKKAQRLAEHYRLSGAQLTEFLAAWDACPLSPHGEKRKEYWQKRNAIKSKSKNHDPLKFCLVECLGIIITDRQDDQVCMCDDSGDRCAICYSLERVGADSPFTPADRDKILGQLAKAREELLPAVAKTLARPEPIADDEIFGG